MNFRLRKVEATFGDHQIWFSQSKQASVCKYAYNTTAYVQTLALMFSHILMCMNDWCEKAFQNFDTVLPSGITECLDVNILYKSVVEFS